MDARTPLPSANVALNDRYILSRLKVARETAGRTQEEAGACLGVNRTTVGHYEIGRRGISPGQLFALANLYDIPVQWFFEGAQA